MRGDRFSRSTDPSEQRIRGMVRRLAVAVTSRVLWQLTGVRSLDGTTETIAAEVFPGVGFFARPRTSGGAPEAILVNVGGATAPAVVATRDEKTRAEVAPLAADESAMFNSEAIVHVKANGEIHARSAGGSAVALATKADIDALRTWAAAHLHNDPSSGVTSTPTVAPPTAAGTSVLKGE